jgi:hypothetical protein
MVKACKTILFCVYASLVAAHRVYILFFESNIITLFTFDFLALNLLKYTPWAWLFFFLNMAPISYCIVDIPL